MKSITKFLVSVSLCFSISNLMALDCEYFKYFINYAEKNHYNNLNNNNKFDNLKLGFKLLVNNVDAYHLFFPPQQVETWVDSISSQDFKEALDQSCSVVEELIADLNDAKEKTKLDFEKLIDRFSSRSDVFPYYQIMKDKFEKNQEIKEDWQLYREYKMLEVWNEILNKNNSEKISYEDMKSEGQLLFMKIINKDTHLPGWFFDTYLTYFLLLSDPHSSFLVQYRAEESKESENYTNSKFGISPIDPMDVTGVIHSGVESTSGKKYNIGVLKIKHFTNSQDEKNCTSFKVREALSILNDSVDSLVVDLRNNSGGDISENLKIINYFLTTPTTVMLEKTHCDKDVELINCSKKEVGTVYNGLFNKPMVILINDKTISSAEDFAATMQDLGRGLVVGGLSYGKGVGQSVLDINFNRIILNKKFNSLEEEENYRKKYTYDAIGGILVLTTLKTFRFSGKSIQNLGVSPDIEIPMSNFQNYDREEDARVKFEDETVDPLDPSEYTRYSIVDDYISDVKSRFDSRKENNDLNILTLSRLVNYDKTSGMYFWKESDEEKITDTILKVATSIAADYVDSINKKD